MDAPQYDQNYARQALCKIFPGKATHCRRTLHKSTAELHTEFTF